MPARVGRRGPRKSHVVAQARHHPLLSRVWRQGTVWVQLRTRQRRRHHRTTTLASVRRQRKLHRPATPTAQRSQASEGRPLRDERRRFRRRRGGRSGSARRSLPRAVRGSLALARPSAGARAAASELMAPAARTRSCALPASHVFHFTFDLQQAHLMHVKKVQKIAMELSSLIFRAPYSWLG